MEGVKNGLYREHILQFGEEYDEEARQCSELLVKAALEGHDQDDWDTTDEILTEYYDAVLEYI